MKKIRAQFLVFLAHKVGLPYFKMVRKQPAFPYTTADLTAMPTESVGFQLHQFFENNALDLLPYYEKHDIKHIILDYPPTEEGEVCLQTFMLANGRITIPILIAVYYGWLTMPEYWSSFKSAWRRGRKNMPLSNLDWIALVPQNINSVKANLLQEKALLSNL